MAAGDQMHPVGQAGRVFCTTRWSMVLEAGGPTSEGSAAALEQLCRVYWSPLYHYARRIGVPSHAAEDLTQSFFAYLLAADVIARADRRRGRFRSFLLTAFKNFHANDRARNAAAKRGGGRTPISLDELRPESRDRLEPRTNLSPERLFDRQWADSLLDQVMRNLRTEYEALKKGPLFELLRPLILGDAGDTGYVTLARHAGLSEGAFKVAVHRIRARFREALRQEVAQTVASPAEVDDELRYLLAALRN